MWNQSGGNNNTNNSARDRGEGERKVGVAIENNKGSKGALKWALDNILTRSQTVTLIHVNNNTTNPSSLPSAKRHLVDVGHGEATPKNESPDGAADLFLPFRVFCSRRQVLWETVTLEEQDTAKALIDYVRYNRINTLVLSAPTRSNISRIFKSDIPSMVLKGAPSFCYVYIIAKGKVASFRGATQPIRMNRIPERRSPRKVRFHDDLDSIDISSKVRLQDEWSIVENDQFSYSYTQERMSTESSVVSFYNNLSSDLEPYPPKSFSGPLESKSKFSDIDVPIRLEKENKVLPCLLPNNEELEEKMRRLELQTKQTMDMYHAACKEALTAKQKAREFQLMKIENDVRLVKAENAKQDAMSAIEVEKEKRKAFYKLLKAAYRKAEKEKQKRLEAEMKANVMLDSVNQYNGFLLRQQSFLHIVIVFLLFYVYFFYVGVF